MSCEFCKGRYERLTGTEFTKKGMIGSMDFHSGKLQINEKKPNGFAWGVIYEIGIRHCPMCGEPLTEPEPLTLEQLRGMDGQPVWVEVLENAEANPPYWAIIDNVGYRSAGVDLISHLDKDFGAYELYGKTWVAYPRKPREG